jgi:hypothetical protein
MFKTINMVVAFKNKVNIAASVKAAKIIVAYLNINTEILLLVNFLTKGLLFILFLLL